VQNRLVSSSLRRTFRTLVPQHNVLAEALKTDYFSDTPYYPEPAHFYLTTPEGQADLSDHLINRLNNFRSFVIPLLNSLLPLKDAAILEIGCGTGASTTSLAEQGAQVTGVDESDRA
jgi:2-polyprenyl-3-methyl-5-hydroxy-6-metoxy-1,4-benzoquinol methylase